MPHNGPAHARVAERQTRCLQVAVSLRAWGFKSPLSHPDVPASTRLRPDEQSGRSLVVSGPSIPMVMGSGHAGCRADRAVRRGVVDAELMAWAIP